MGENIGERGKIPKLEKHYYDGRGAPGHEMLLRLRTFARLTLCSTHLSEFTLADAQRFFKQVIPGSELVVGEVSVMRKMPTYFLVCTRRSNAAYLVLPGSASVSDMVTDLSAEEEPLLGGHAHKGMVLSARWLLDELRPVLVHLHAQGYQVNIVGHSLGAAIGAILTLMLRSEISTLLCYGFGMPACVDESL